MRGRQKNTENYPERYLPIDVVTTAAVVTTTSDITAEDSDFKFGGRPTGTTDDRKREIDEINKKCINEITMIYEHELKKSKTMKKNSPKDFFKT